MNIEYPPHPPTRDVWTFDQLIPGTWYRGVQTGRLYFFYLGDSARAHHLLRADDNCECTSRYQRGGTFRPVEVTVIVHACKPSGGGSAVNGWRHKTPPGQSPDDPQRWEHPHRDLGLAITGVEGQEGWYMDARMVAYTQLSSTTLVAAQDEAHKIVRSKLKSLIDGLYIDESQKGGAT